MNGSVCVCEGGVFNGPRCVNMREECWDTVGHGVGRKSVQWVEVCEEGVLSGPRCVSMWKEH